MCNNTGAIAHSKNLVHNPKTKHFLLKELCSGETGRNNCQTQDMTVHVLTQAIPKVRNRNCILEMKVRKFLRE